MSYRIVIFLLLAQLCFGQSSTPRPSLRERAQAGDAEAQFNLGKMYEAGRGGLKKDYVEAVRWYRLSADQGDPYAQASMGILFRFGKGVAQDNVQAYMWFHLAASQTTGGEHESIAEMREAAGARMTREQIAEAKRLAREWKQKRTP